MMIGTNLNVVLEGNIIGQFQIIDNLPDTIVAVNSEWEKLHFKKDCSRSNGGITYIHPYTKKQMREKFGQTNPFSENLRRPYKLSRREDN